MLNKLVNVMVLGWLVISGTFITMNCYKLYYMKPLTCERNQWDVCLCKGNSMFDNDSAKVMYELADCMGGK